MEHNLSIDIVSVEDRDSLVAEIWHEGEMLAEVQKSADGLFLVDIYSSKSKQSQTFYFDELVNTLIEAKKRLN